MNIQMRNTPHHRSPNTSRTAFAGLWRVLGAALALACELRLAANPQGLSVATGSATPVANGSRLDVTVSQNAFLNWRSFNIAPGETTTFHQPSPASIVWNKINDANPSQIWGRLNANGVVVLMNQSGFFFGPGSVVNAAGFIATTATTLPEFGMGGTWQFNGPPPSASIINFGEIKVSSGGSAFLIAEKVENHGTLTAPDGTLGLYAGKEVLMSERPDGRGLSAVVRLPEGSVNNQGKLVADAGSIMLQASTVNQNGLIQANSVRERNGVIELVASDNITLGADSILSARGGAAGISAGGQITVKSGNSYQDHAGSQIQIGGGAQGGDGGTAELSAPFMNEILTAVDGAASRGYRGGSLLIDPRDISLGYVGTGSANGGNVGSGGAPANGTLSLNVLTAFRGLSQIRLQATRNITVSAEWDLASSTGISAPGSLLSLEAGSDITLRNGAGIRGGSGWSVSLAAGRNFGVGGSLLANVGSVTLEGNSYIETQDGSITLLAGKNITVGSGYVRTMAGGDISVLALAGSVNTGTRGNGYIFIPSANPALLNYMIVDPSLGGISTAAGGDVTINAGTDIASLLPSGTPTVNVEGGSGAYGAQPGNVTLIAGRNVTGHYVARNGAGLILAGGNAGMANRVGTLERPLALSLASGGWTVTAAGNILLQEVRNPNGVYNSGSFPRAAQHLFDYSADAYVELHAGNKVSLTGGGPRRAGDFEQGLPAIYPPSLQITAGAGGVELADNLTLFPSAAGQLSILTTDGGSVRPTQLSAGSLLNLVMSDSGKTQYRSASDFGPDDHAAVPVHADDANPIRLDISGNLEGILLVLPKRAEISVAGDMRNSNFRIQHARSSDQSLLNVGGDIWNRNVFTYVFLAQKPDFEPLQRVVPYNSIIASLGGKFIFDERTHQLILRGRLTTTEAKALTEIIVQIVDPITLQPVLDEAGNAQTEVVHLLDSATIQYLLNHSQDVPAGAGIGYQIAGPGSLSITARNIDLGATLGIQSVGPLYNSALALRGSSGASIRVNASGNLDMFSSSIASFAGGDVRVTAGGTITAGTTLPVGDGLARGIFTVARSDVSVVAGGNINISGSRIAAYDGGNIEVASLNGNVDAGSGGQGAVQVTKVVVDPVTGRVLTYTPTIPGSGILATTFPTSLDPDFPNSPNPVGHITVQALKGNINASAGGIVQVALNGVASPAAYVNLTAGGDIDASGSGVIGERVNLKAGGDILGVVIANQGLGLNAGRNFSGTAFSAGGADIAAAGNVSGTVIAMGSANVSGSAISAGILSANATTSGNVSSSSQVGFSQGKAATTTSAGAASTDRETRKASIDQPATDEDDQKKKTAAAPVLARRVGRVTVILPKS